MTTPWDTVIPSPEFDEGRGISLCLPQALFFSSRSSLANAGGRV